MLKTPEDVLRFWLEEVGPEQWYAQDSALDARMSELFLETWQAAREGHLDDWRTGPRHALAFVILTDQFPRNMFRGDPRSFATDARARAAAKDAHDKGWDKLVEEPARQFFYMPFVHSESLTDQDKGVCLIKNNMTETGMSNLLHARAHREVIRRYSRFPFRNVALGRETSADESAFLDSGGYRSVVQSMSG